MMNQCCGTGLNTPIPKLIFLLVPLVTKFIIPSSIEDDRDL